MSILPRILLVEDDPADLHLAMKVFAGMNLADQIVSVADGVEAVDFLEGRNRFSSRPPGNPALVLLDLKMPRIDGLELLEAVKSNAALRCIPMVCLTSSRDESDVRRAYELGANGYVVKTIDFEEYSESLRAVGAFWATANEPPPGCLPRPKPQ